MANLKRPPLFRTTYDTGTSDVTVSLVFGTKQFGTAMVWLNGKELGRGDITKLTVGKGSALSGSTLAIKSVVTDLNDKSNLTEMKIHLDGGKVPGRHSLSVEVDENGDSAIYRAEVEFK